MIYRTFFARCLRQLVLPSKYSAMASSTSAITQSSTSGFDYFLVLDFEATCNNTEKIEPQEIIEFPVLKVNSRTWEIESIFHKYVQPRVHNELTPFCTELTGIIQEMVDGKPNIEETLQMFYDWMKTESLIDADGAATTSAFVTCGDWDLKVMLKNQAQYFGITYPEYLKSWINIKKIFVGATGHYPKGMMEMLAHFNIKHTGRHHSGIDDCRNIAKILKALGQRHCQIERTGYLP